MLCYEVRVNRKLACTAGVGKQGVLTAIVTWVKRDRKKCPDDLSKAEWSREELYLHVGGIMGGTDHVDWLKQDLRPGDEVHIRVVQRPTADHPARRTGQQLCQGRHTFEEPNEARVAVRARKRDPASGLSYEVHLSEVIGGDHPLDDSVDVEVVFDKGARYLASFLKDPLKGKGRKGSKFSVDEDMILVPKLTKKAILHAVAALIAEGNLEPAFRRVADANRHTKRRRRRS
jgi:hypothetical protein